MDFVLNEFHRDISDAELLEDVKRVYDLLGKNSMTASEYTKHGKYHATTVQKRFGGMTRAMDLCGIRVSDKQRLAAKTGGIRENATKEEILKDIIWVSKQLDKKQFSSSEYSTLGHFSAQTCFKYLETWNNALLLAGLEPYSVVSGKRIDDDALLQEIEKMWISLGRQPTATDVRNGCSQYALNAYTRHFGGWRNALVAFVEWVNADKPEEIIIPEQPKAASPQNKPAPVPTKPEHSTTRDIGLRLRFRIMQRDNFKCCLCGASPALTPGVQLHIDHIVPWSKGGETVLENLQTLCSDCNLGKGNLE